MNWTECDQDAYIYTSVLYKNNKSVLDEQYGYHSEELDLALYHIYKIFSYLQDKGASYSKVSSTGSRIVLFKEKTYGAEGNISLMIYPQFSQIETKLVPYTQDRDFIRIMTSNDQITLNGCIRQGDNPPCTIRGNNQTGKFLLTITDGNNRYHIESEEPWRLFATLTENVIGRKLWQELTSSKLDAGSRISNYLWNQGLGKHQEQLHQLLSHVFHSSANISCFQEEISQFFISASFQKYLEELPYHPHIQYQKEEIKGLQVDKDAIERFKQYQVADRYTGKKRFITDIPLQFIDMDNYCECEFLDALNQIPDEEVDIFIIGMAYFATYCRYFGEMTGRNLYGAGIYPRYAGYKMDVAGKSSVLGIPLSSFARARYVNGGEHVPEICIVFKMLGFQFGEGEKNGTILESKPLEIDINPFKQLLPYNDTPYQKTFS